MFKEFLAPPFLLNYKCRSVGVISFTLNESILIENWKYILIPKTQTCTLIGYFIASANNWIKNYTEKFPTCFTRFASRCDRAQVDGGSKLVCQITVVVHS